MRFGLAHKVATYLMVLSAYLAMVTGGGVSPLIALLGLAGLVTSWWWEPPVIRYEKWALAWTLASLLVLAYTVLSAVATGDYLGIAGEFLIWLTVAKACNRRAARDWQQLYLLAFMMLVAGSVLNSELEYGVAFLMFVVTSTWALALFHLRREMEDNFLLKHADDRASERVEVRRILASRRIVDRRFFVGTAAVSLVVFVASAVFFLAMPRVGMGFFFKSRDGLSMIGFSEEVKLGGHGTLKNDSRIIMRVEIDEAYGGPSRPMIHWRGAVLDEYADGQWRRSVSAPQTIGVPDVRNGQLTLTLDYVPEERMVKQEIFLEPMDSNILFGAARVTAMRYPRPRDPIRTTNDEIRVRHTDTLHYTAYADLGAPPEDVLRARPRIVDAMPANFWPYLALPCEDGEGECPAGVEPITERTKALAREITAGAATDYDRARAIESWLRENLAYTLQLEEIPAGREAVDFFLFDRKKGHCEFFASAFAVLARSIEIPVRNVNGFLGGEWNDYYVAVRAGDAHAWSEVWFPGYGWVTFDATPPGNIDQLGRGDSGVIARIRRLFDRLRFQWTKWVIEYDLVRQLSFFRSVGGALKSAGRAIRAALVAIKEAILAHWYVVAPLGLALVALIALRIRRRRGSRGDDGPGGARRRRKRPIAELWTTAITRLTRRGLVRDPALTPREQARRWTAAGAAELRELTELYYAVEYGGADEAGAVARARALRDAIDAAQAS
jgi:transglutaminase-like putative cysteine protease